MLLPMLLLFSCFSLLSATKLRSLGISITRTDSQLLLYCSVACFTFYCKLLFVYLSKTSQQASKLFTSAGEVSSTSWHTIPPLRTLSMLLDTNTPPRWRRITPMLPTRKTSSTASPTQNSLAMEAADTPIFSSSRTSWHASCPPAKFK